MKYKGHHCDYLLNMLLLIKCSFKMETGRRLVGENILTF